MFGGGIRASAFPLGDFAVGELALYVSCVTALPISPSCCCWRSMTSWGLAPFRHRSASRIFITQSGCGLSPMVIYKDDHQPCVERSELGCGLPLPSASRMFISLAGVESEPSWGSAFCMSWWPASCSSIWRKRMCTSLAREANFGYAVPAGPQAPPATELPAPWLGWSCPHPRRRAGARASLPWRTCRGGRRRWCRGGRRR
jgi:hypothetical protein